MAHKVVRCGDITVEELGTDYGTNVKLTFNSSLCEINVVFDENIFHDIEDDDVDEQGRLLETFQKKVQEKIITIHQYLAKERKEGTFVSVSSSSSGTSGIHIKDSKATVTMSQEGTYEAEISFELGEHATACLFRATQAYLQHCLDDTPSYDDTLDQPA